MPSMQYRLAKAHVVTKQEVGRDLAKKVVDPFSSEANGTDWHVATIKDGEGYRDVIVEYSGVDVGLMVSANEVHGASARAHARTETNSCPTVGAECILRNGESHV